MWIIFKAFIEFFTILLLFFVLSFFGHEIYGILAPQPGFEPHLLHWKVKSQPLAWKGSPDNFFFNIRTMIYRLPVIHLPQKHDATDEFAHFAPTRLSPLIYPTV